MILEFRPVLRKSPRDGVCRLHRCAGKEVTGWESNATVPEIRYIPAIIRFLGYDPLPVANSLREHLATARMTLGLSQRKMAERLGVDPATLMGWEAGRHPPSEKSLDLIGKVLPNW